MDISETLRQLNRNPKTVKTVKTASIKPNEKKLNISHKKDFTSRNTLKLCETAKKSLKETLTDISKSRNISKNKNLESLYISKPVHRMTFIGEINKNPVNNIKSRNQVNEISKNHTTTDNKSFRNKTGDLFKKFDTATHGIKIKEIKKNPVVVNKSVTKTCKTNVQTTQTNRYIVKNKSIKFLLLNENAKLDFNKSKEGFFDFTNAVKESNKSKSKDKKLITTISSNKLSSTVSNFSNKTLSFTKNANNSSKWI
jgi:hypothetical protein